MTCVKCNAAVAIDDPFCSSCGRAMSVADRMDFIPLPGVTGPVDLRIRKRTRRSWYRERRLVMPLAALAMVAAAVAVYFPL